MWADGETRDKPRSVNQGESQGRREKDRKTLKERRELVLGTGGKVLLSVPYTL